LPPPLSLGKPNEVPQKILLLPWEGSFLHSQGGNLRYNKGVMSENTPPPANHPKVFKPRTPLGLIIGIVVVCVGLLVGVFVAVNSLQRGFADARMTGTIIEKNFSEAPQREVTFGEQGLQAMNVRGEFTLTVRVRERDGETRDFTVWVPEVMFNEVAVGDRFDVGPFLVPTED
jgi:hypothetical protein